MSQKIYAKFFPYHFIIVSGFGIALISLIAYMFRYNPDWLLYVLLAGLFICLIGQIPLRIKESKLNSSINNRRTD